MRAGYALVLATLLPSAALAQVTDTASYLQRMDSDGDGKVSEAEYVQWMLYAFDRMDRNGDGVLTADELPGGKGRAIGREQQRQQGQGDAERHRCLHARGCAACIAPERRGGQCRSFPC